MSPYLEVIQKLLLENHGIITTSQVTKQGIPRRCLTEMVEANIIYKAERGIYTLPDVWEDEMYFMQYRFAKGIFSHETALYLHNMTDRTPIRYTMSFPLSYNLTNAKNYGIKTKSSTNELYNLGVITVLSPVGNKIKVYDIERTLCDIVKTRHHADIQVITQAMKMYASSSTKDIGKLMNYAKKLGVSSKISRYMEVLL